MNASDIYDSLYAINQQARALVGQTNLVLRSLEPMVAAERDQQEVTEKPRPKTFGRKDG